MECQEVGHFSKNRKFGAKCLAVSIREIIAPMFIPNKQVTLLNHSSLSRWRCNENYEDPIAFLQQSYHILELFLIKREPPVWLNDKPVLWNLFKINYKDIKIKLKTLGEIRL